VCAQGWDCWGWFFEEAANCPQQLWFHDLTSGAWFEFLPSLPEYFFPQPPVHVKRPSWRRVSLLTNEGGIFVQVLAGLLYVFGEKSF
jgi:hypothetical protein